MEVDGARFATIQAGAVKELGLVRGMELDRATLERLTFQADVDGADRVAIRLLAARPRSVRELLWRLRQHGLNPAAVAKAVGGLEARGLLNDEEFARHFVRVRSAKGHGPSRLLTDLLAKGVERKLAQRAIDEVLEAEGVDPLEQARGLALKRLGQLGKLPPQKRRRRLLGYLERRGFRGHDVREMVAEIVGKEAGGVEGNGKWET